MSTLVVNKATDVAGTSFYELMRLETAKSATGTAVEFTSIPSWVKRITVMFSGVSGNGTSNPIAQLGTSAAYATSGYLGASSNQTGGVSTNFTTGHLLLLSTAAADIFYGMCYFTNITGNTWVSNSMISLSNSSGVRYGAGSIALADTLTRLRITATNGTDAFDAGTINVIYEGYNV